VPLCKEISATKEKSDEDETAMSIYTTTATTMTMTTALTSEPATTESTAAPSTPANGVPNDDVCTMERIKDLNCRTAKVKKRKMQEYSAEKEMNRRGEELIAEGLGVGAVVIWSTHSCMQRVWCA
jgi:hypothetical protein